MSIIFAYRRGTSRQETYSLKNSHVDCKNKSYDHSLKLHVKQKVGCVSELFMTYGTFTNSGLSLIH